MLVCLVCEGGGGCWDISPTHTPSLSLSRQQSGIVYESINLDRRMVLFCRIIGINTMVITLCN